MPPDGRFVHCNVLRFSCERSTSNFPEKCLSVKEVNAQNLRDKKSEIYGMHNNC